MKSKYIILGIILVAAMSAVSSIAQPVPGAQLKIAHIWSDKPLARTGETIKFSVFVENTGNEGARDISLELRAPEEIRVSNPIQKVAVIPGGSYRRVDWNLKAEKSDTSQLELTAMLKSSDGGVVAKGFYKILVIDRDARYTRQELCTDAHGYWRLLPKPTTLQQDNTEPLNPIKHLKSDQIKHSTYGLCIQLPRLKDYEDPFDPEHLIDNDSKSCWSSQEHSSAFPGVPPWVEIDLGRMRDIKQVNLIPYWRNTDFPLGFTIFTSSNGQAWNTDLQMYNYHLVDSGTRRGDKLVQAFALTNPVRARYVKVEFKRLPPCVGNYAETAGGHFARLSGIEVIDGSGYNVALKDSGASVKASSYFTGWQNTAKTIGEAFGRTFDLGVKWVRVGQWGDQTEWAAVERKKGEFHMDSKTNAAIHKLLDNGVQILYGLNYGNHLYEKMSKPLINIGPVYKEGNPFYKNIGPRTKAERKAFLRYVNFVVRKYGYKDGHGIKYWELWNEENGWYDFFHPVLYGKLLYDVAKDIKKIDPSVKVMFGGTAAPAPIYTEIALGFGAAPYLDATAFHPYGIEKPEGGMGTMERYHYLNPALESINSLGVNLSQSQEQTGWNNLEQVIRGVKKPFADHGNPNVQVWEDEWNTGGVSGLGFSTKSGIGEYGCSKYLLRFYVYGGWLKAPTAWWSLYTMNNNCDWGIIDPHNFSFRPMAYALQNVCSVLSDVEPIDSLSYKYNGTAPDPIVVGFKKDDGDTVVAVWAAELHTEQVKSYPSSLSFKLSSRPNQVTLTDLYWGVSQPASWSYENGMLTLHGLVVHDYPVVIRCH